jgi:hypothetical protein
VKPGQTPSENAVKKPAEKPAEKPTQTPAVETTPEKPEQKTPAKVEVTQVTPGKTTPYDRYMQAGYAATQKRDHEAALRYFKRALDERPGNLYATRAIENTERYLARERENPPTQASPTPIPSPQSSR